MAVQPANSEPANFGLSECSVNGLFSVRGLPAQTHLDRIYLNGLHTLLPFWITNKTGQTLGITLAASPARALKFQRHNANWDAVSAASRKAYVDVQPASNSDNSDNSGEVTLRCSAETQREYCEVFNQIDGVGSIVLLPHETAELVLLVEARMPVVPGTELATSAAAGSGEEGSSHFAFVSSHASILFQAATMNGSLAEKDSYSARLRSSYCRSVLEMDPPTSRIYLDDCAVGKPYERVLRVRNASEIGLDWTMTVVETTDTTTLSSLQLLDAEMRPLSGGHLAGCAATQIFIRYTPRAAGEFLCRFLVENSNDPSNQRYWVFRARSTQRQKPKRVELLGDPDIDFGNCTSGVWYNREIAFKNISDTPVVMRFRVEGNTSNLTMRCAVKAKQSPATTSEQSTEPPEELGQDPAVPTLLLDSTEEAFPLHDSLSEQQGGPDGDSISESVLASDSRSGAIVAVAASDLDPTLDHTSLSATSASRHDPSASVQEPRDGGRRLHPRDRPTASHGLQPSLFDEVLIKPGSMRTVILSLIGNATCTVSLGAGQFGTQSFTLFCECSAPAGSKQSPPSPLASKGTSSVADRSIERLSLPCTLNMCTSYVRVTPALLDFGTVDVGMLKTMYLQVENLSHVEATVQCRLESKVINCTRDPVVIPPLMSETIRVDIYPRRINPRYRKQIIVCNRRNRFNDSVVEVRSIHVDQRRMAFHNLFYKTLVLDNEQNFVDFGAVPLNSRTVRMISLRNICRCPIAIETSVSDSSNIGAPPDPSNSSGMLVVYKIVPLLKNGALTPEARLVARRLPLLERQAVIHSNIERFKEHSGGPLLAAEQAVASLSEPHALHSLARSNGYADPKPATGLQPDMFVDKTVEQGHVCLVPFLPRGRTVRNYRSVDYLDVASEPKQTLSSVRIRESSLWPLSDKSTEEIATMPWSPLASIDESTLPHHSLAYSELAALTSDGLIDAHTPEDVDTLEILGRARRLLSEIVDNLDLVPPVMFSSPQAEDEYVRRQVDLRKYIDLLVESGFLRPPRRMVLAAGSDRSLVIMMCPVEAPDVADKAVSPRFDANVYFRLVNRPSDLLPFTESGESAAVFTNSYQLPVRRFLVQASLCRTELEIGQKSINVGNMQVDEASRKYLIIKNHTETPLMYAIRKTGSIASGDIQFVDNNRYGVVRGFDSRKIVFVFTPSLSGTYSEQISIANVLDPQGGKTATLKAVVRRPSKFYIQSLLLEFGKQTEEEHLEASNSSHTLKIGQRSDEAQLLVIKNMTAKTRQFVVKSVKDMQAESLPTPLPQTQPQLQLLQGREQGAGIVEATPYTRTAVTPSNIADGETFEDSVTLDPLFPADITALAQSAKVLDRETEEKIEALEQKLKIAVRKNRPEKAEKYTSKLAKLRGSGASLDPGAAVQFPKISPLVSEAGSRATTVPGATSSAATGDTLGVRSPPSASQAAVTIQRLAADTQLLVTLPASSEASIPVVVVPRMINSSVEALGRRDSAGRCVVSAKGQLVVHEGKDKDNVKVVTLQALVEIDASAAASQPLDVSSVD
ncbi:hypothetical protein GGI18_000782 [Coemansia linderi]|uniref:Uncharacterized protein n=1 Tax=Coemansia linderi TaxID=2663919 RepID=A0ACC1KND2_9FUNG|nr:hypothetical protein GGI18_000782 [Coemansia linderi]